MLPPTICSQIEDRIEVDEINYKYIFILFSYIFKILFARNVLNNATADVVLFEQFLFLINSLFDICNSQDSQNSGDVQRFWIVSRLLHSK